MIKQDSSLFPYVEHLLFLWGHQPPWNQHFSHRLIAAAAWSPAHNLKNQTPKNIQMNSV